MSADQFEPRRASPGETFEEYDSEGGRHELTADDDGVVRPRNAFEERMLDHHGLPVARKAMEEDKPKSPKGGKD